MNSIHLKKYFCILFVVIFLFSSNAFAEKIVTKEKSNDNKNDKIFLIDNSILAEDIDPLVDLNITVSIKEIRALDKIDILSNPDFYIKLFINDEEFKSKTWKNQKYVNETWSVTKNVPDNIEFVNITIELWDSNIGSDKLCDISGNTPSDPNSYSVNLYYSLKTGHWMGDDFYRNMPILFDKSGYGRLNGCDDFTYQDGDNDCEIIFDITQNDYDNDGIPYWAETNIFNKSGQCDPLIDDSGRDDDEDGIPIEWEYKWGHSFSQSWYHGNINHKWFYNPFIYNDHKNIDLDLDGLDNVEEYLTSQWGSDPFRKDIFVEIDQMKVIKENDETLGAYLPKNTKNLIRDGYSKHNIFLHVDDGCMGGGQIIPFDYNTSSKELQDFHFKYFMNNNSSYWRRGVFHYGLIIFKADRARGNAFSTTTDGKNYSIDSYQLSTSFHEVMPQSYPILDLLRRGVWDKEKQRAMIYAGVMMHEIGHSLGIFGGSQVPGCDNSLSIFPRIFWFRFKNYKSCMNYNYVYSLVDYSDGSHGKNDHDDWDLIDLTLFQQKL